MRKGSRKRVKIRDAIASSALCEVLDASTRNSSPPGRANFGHVRDNKIANGLRRNGRKQMPIGVVDLLKLSVKIHNPNFIIIMINSVID